MALVEALALSEVLAVLVTELLRVPEAVVVHVEVIVVGDSVGAAEGAVVGPPVGAAVGAAVVGTADGAADGASVGCGAAGCTRVTIATAASNKAAPAQWRAGLASPAMIPKRSTEIRQRQFPVWGLPAAAHSSISAGSAASTRLGPVPPA